MTGGSPTYSATCQHCGRVTVTAERFRDAELAGLREHAGRCFASDALADRSGAGEVLRRFTVGCVP